MSPFAARLFSKLAGQLVPAALVATMGVLALSNLAKAPSAKPAAASAATAITAEAVVRVTPREAVEPQADDAKPVKAVRTAAKPKPVAASIVPVRAAVNEPSPQTASLPLPIVPAAPLADAAPIAGERSMMGRLRDATATVVSRLAETTVTSSCEFVMSNPRSNHRTVPRGYGHPVTTRSNAGR